MTEKQGQVSAKPALDRIRTLHKIMVGILVAYIPAIVVLYLMKLPEWVMVFVAVLLVCGGIVAAFMIGYSRCPTCGECFHVRGMTGNIFVRRCMHCGLQL